MAENTRRRALSACPPHSDSMHLLMARLESQVLAKMLADRRQHVVGLKEECNKLEAVHRQQQKLLQVYLNRIDSQHCQEAPEQSRQEKDEKVPQVRVVRPWSCVSSVQKQKQRVQSRSRSKSHRDEAMINNLSQTVSNLAAEVDAKQLILLRVGVSSPNQLLALRSKLQAQKEESQLAIKEQLLKKQSFLARDFFQRLRRQINLFFDKDCKEPGLLWKEEAILQRREKELRVQIELTKERTKTLLLRKEHTGLMARRVLRKFGREGGEEKDLAGQLRRLIKLSQQTICLLQSQ